jgi:diguanylate cyclase (GGDEF)-like protein
MKPYRSIKLKVALAATVIFLTAVGIISAVQLRQLRSETVRMLSDQQFTLVTRLATEIDEKLETRRAVLASEAASMPADIVNSEKRLRARYDNETALHTLFDGFSVISTRGSVVYTTRETPGWSTVNVSDRPYFKEVMASHAPVITEPFLGKLQKLPRIAIAAPIFNVRGEVAAIMVGVLDLLQDNFLGAIGDSRIGREGYFYIVANGPYPVIIAHRNKSRIMQSALPIAAANPSLARALQGYEGTLVGTNSYGLKGLFTFKTLTNANWVLAAVLPQDEAFESITHTERTTLFAALLISVLVAACVWIVIYRLLTPLEDLRVTMQNAISNPGNTRLPLENTALDEIGVLTCKFNELMAARDHAKEQLEHAARHDILTGLPNRMLFNDRFEQALHRSRRNRQPIALMYVDVDRFKTVNDTLGHGVGDQLLMQFAQRATTCVRASDTVARLGGDEFAILLENVAHADVAGTIAEKLIAAMRVEFNLGEAMVRATASIGIAFVQDLSRNAETILKAADEALYAAKAAGRNNYRLVEI